MTASPRPDDGLAAYDGLDVEAADMIADGDGWGFRFGREEATGSVRVDLKGATDRLPLVVETRTDSSEASAGVYLSPTEAEALATTLLDAAEALRDDGREA